MQNLTLYFNRYQNTRQVLDVHGRYKYMAYIILTKKEVDNLPLAYITYEFYKELPKHADYNKLNILRNAAGFITFKYNPSIFTGGSNIAVELKNLLSSLYEDYTEKVKDSKNQQIIYDHYILCIIVEVIFHKCLKEYNRHNNTDLSVYDLALIYRGKL